MQGRVIALAALFSSVLAACGGGGGGGDPGTTVATAPPPAAAAGPIAAAPSPTQAPTSAPTAAPAPAPTPAPSAAPTPAPTAAPAPAPSVPPNMAWGLWTETVIAKPGGQFSPGFAILPSGRRAVAWLDATATAKRALVKVQLMSAQGAPVGPELVVGAGEVINDGLTRVQVVAQPDGGFFVIWNSPSTESLIGPPQAPANWSTWSVQKFDASGTPVAAVVQLYAPNTKRATGFWLARPLASGGAVLLLAPTGEYTGTATATLIDVQGQKVRDVDGIGAGTPGYLEFYDFAVAPTANGGFVVTWTGREDAGLRAQKNTVYGQRFAADGSSLEPMRDIVVLDSPAFFTSVSESLTGDLMVAIGRSETTPTYQHVDHYDLLRFGADWTPKAVAATSQAAGSAATLSRLADGGFVLVWYEAGDTFWYSPAVTSHLLAQRFTSEGQAFGQVFTVSEGTYYGGFYDVQPSPDGGLQVLQSRGQDSASDLILDTFSR